ncbi:MAG: hypothetical protein C4589_02635 [Peptococcaceae bacterium]|nr:MAG: hypothetical protein C4589_02635 [Peptococcaceae bacterium]
MISTVTTTTTTTASMVSSLAAGLDLSATLSLIALLLGKELAGGQVSAGSEATAPGALEKYANVGIIPLLFAFGSVVLTRVLAVFQ